MQSPFSQTSIKDMSFADSNGYSTLSLALDYQKPETSVKMYDNLFDKKLKINCLQEYSNFGKNQYEAKFIMDQKTKKRKISELMGTKDIFKKAGKTK